MPGRGDDRDVGTLAYMAPEQLGPHSGAVGPTRPARYDARTDVWGLGATLYELLSLRLPFSGQTTAEIARKILSEPPAPERLDPRELKAICLKALEEEPDERYPSAAAFAADLRRWLESRPTLAGESVVHRKFGRAFGGPWVGIRRIGFWSRRRPAAAFVVGLLTTLLLVGILGAKAQLDAAQREIEILALTQHRRPIRQNDWSEKSWKLALALRGSSTSPDPRLQGLAAAALEGIDARVVKTMPGPAQAVEFDPRSERLLLFQMDESEKVKSWFRTTLWDRTTDRTLVVRDWRRSPRVQARRDATATVLGPRGAAEAEAFHEAEALQRDLRGHPRRVSISTRGPVRLPGDRPVPRRFPPCRRRHLGPSRPRQTRPRWRRHDDLRLGCRVRQANPHAQAQGNPGPRLVARWPPPRGLGS